MTDNNSEQTTETNESSVTTDATGTTENDAVVSESSTEVEGNTDISDGVESTSENDTGDDLFFDLDGEEVSVAQVRDWKNNGLMQADYTKKRQVDAEARKVLDADQAKTIELNNQLTETLSSFQDALQEDYKKVDWDYLMENDTGEYLKQQKLFKAKAQKLVDAKKELTARQELEREDKVANAQKLFLEKNPTWADPKQKDADIAIMDAYVTENGFDEQMINGLTDHRLMQAVLDASKYRELLNKSAETGKTVQQAPNVIKASKKTAPKQKTGTDLWYGTGT